MELNKTSHTLAGVTIAFPAWFAVAIEASHGVDAILTIWIAGAQAQAALVQICIEIMT